MRKAAPAPRVIAVVGPTAAGKSDLGVALARHFDGEVVNADSMQLYRGMDIGTAKLTTEERGGVPHHLLDIWDVTDTANVADYQRLARLEIDRLLAEGRTPCSSADPACTSAAPWTSWSSPAPTRRSAPGWRRKPRCAAPAPCTPGSPPPIRQPPGRSCPATAAASSARWRSSRSPAAPFTANLPGHESVYDTVQIGVDVARPELDERIALRVDRMWEAGLVDEVRALEARGLRDGITASRALGYQQVLAALAGECTEDEARAETVRATKRFARRQDSWFRRDPRVHWLSGAVADRGELPGLAQSLVERAVTA